MGASLLFPGNSLSGCIESVITNHVDVTLIEVACGYFRTEFDPIAS